jgi:hypothetical protein
MYARRSSWRSFSAAAGGNRSRDRASDAEYGVHLRFSYARWRQLALQKHTPQIVTAYLHRYVNEA